MVMGLLIVFMLGIYPHAQAGVVVYGTRFVLNESSSVKVTLQNTDSLPFLLKNDIGTVKGSNTDGQPILITPPLRTIGGSQSIQLRLICSSCEELPQDRESFFWLSISAIPKSSDGNRNNVQIALRQRFKVFYRPKSILIEDASKAYTRLKFLKQRGVLHFYVENSSPFYITILNMYVNGVKVNAPKMISPFDTVTYEGCPKEGTCTITWSAIDDFGAILPTWSVVLDNFAKSGTPKK